MAYVPDAVVGFLLENLKDFVVTNADLIAGAEDNAYALCDELELLKGFLKACTEKRYSDDGFLAGLAKKVRKLVHRAEDAIEIYIATVSKQKFRSTVKSAVYSIDHVFELRKIGKELDALKREVHSVYETEMRSGFQIMQRVDQEKRKEDEGSVRKAVDEDMVGCEDEVEKMTDLLISGTEKLEVISITGMLGLGKTTLARRVFKNPSIQYHFDIRAFVSVSQVYERKQVLLDILRASSDVTEQMLEMPDEDLAERVYKSLKMRRFLIVMDDVWSTEAWNDLKVALPSDQIGSRILLTTEQTTVATNASRMGSTHALRSLYPHESRELLRRKVFGDIRLPEELEKYESAILEKCNGLPLAIIVVAGTLLNNRNDIYWWGSVADGVISGEGLTSKEVVRLSFNQLPQHLKLCFLYLGVFREDFDIPARTLLQLWMAEGLIQEDTHTCLEDVATKYLEELVHRNLLTVQKRRSDGRVKTCKIHDTLHKFCMEEAKKENFFQDAKHSSLDNCRRISINSDIAEFLRSMPKANIRSLLSFPKEDFPCPAECTSSIPKAFKLLRVLDVRSIKLGHFPAELCYLFLLRYIAIYGNLKILPEELSMLCNLQTLIILTTEGTLQIKADISKMSFLRHLYSNASMYLQAITGKPAANENLQSLSTISPESCGKEIVLLSPNLKKLGIRGDLSTILEGNLLDYLSRLENLKLLHDNNSGKLKALPHVINFPRKLTCLTLSNTYLEWYHMSTLGKLEYLEVLKLKDNAFEGHLWETEDGEFPRLKALYIGTTNLRSWHASEDHFPNLVSLFLRHCTKLAALPSGLADMPCLQTIDLYSCNRNLAASARKISILKHELGDQSFQLSVYPPDQ